MGTLSDTIAAIAERARKYSTRGLGEQNTKASLVEPILEGLGWDIRDPEEVHREFRPTGKDSPVDYALKLMRQARLFVEAKGLGETLGDRKWIAQVLGYATVAGVEWCVLTDGDEYRFYNATAPIDADEKMFCRVRLTEAAPFEAAKVLNLISRGNLEQNLLESLWQNHFVDRRVRSALQEMLSAPDKSLVRLVRSRAPKLAPKDIAQSIRRMDIRQPAVTLPDLTRQKPARPTRIAEMEPRKTEKRKPVSIDVSLQQAIAAGLVRPPLRLFKRYKGHELEAKLLPSGQVEFAGQPHSTCSAAAEAARATVAGRRMNTNGWGFWQFEEATGKRRTLDSLRRRLLGRNDRTAPPLRLAGVAAS